MTKRLRLLVALPAILFVVTGLRWVTAPTGVAADLGMPLLEGVGRSSQIGDFGALFFTMGLMILIALVTARRSWFYAPAMILACAALFRILAWLFHDAALPIPMVVLEVVVSSLLLFASTRLSLKE